MEQNQHISSTQLYDYIKENNLEFDAMLMLVFNTVNYYYIPLLKPMIQQGEYAGLPHILFGANDTNILSTKYQYYSANLNLKQYKGGSQILLHPECLHGYMSMYNNVITIEYFFEQSILEGKRRSRKAAITNFIESVGIKTVNELRNFMDQGHSRMISDFFEIEKFNPPRISHEDCIFDKTIEKSYTRRYSETELERIKINFRKGLSFSEAHYISNTCITDKISIGFHGYDIEKDKGRINGLSIQLLNYPKNKIKTPLDCDYAIVNREDKISDILYNAALRIRATNFRIAVGYAYDSGLELISPAIMSARHMAFLNHSEGDCHADLVVGSLQNYDGVSPIKQMSRASAQRINDLRQSLCIKHLYTCPSRFYHGKFYYIGNDSESYVLVGSSNITKPAFENNYELDVLYHFILTEEESIKKEKQFKDWFSELLQNCTEINELNESVFPSTTVQDENGYSSKSSIYRSLTNDEERDRYLLLESYSPSRIVPKPFKGKAYSPFNDYALFEYASRGISVLECFNYGKSCYIFNTVKEDEIKALIGWKSKDKVKEIEQFIADVQHDNEYRNTIIELFANYKEDK